MSSPPLPHDERLLTLFTQLADLPPDAWADTLIQLCPDDPALQAELLALLHADRAEAEAPLFNSPLAALPGSEVEATHIGPYRILRLIGEGGMGRVYLAERADDAYQKQVAIKVLAHRMVAGALQRRFEYEKHILASLEHPHIARLYDAGTEAGWSYFVMEYVDGQPLTTYCDAHTRSVEDRLRLFLQVCRAVQYAQERGVIHRDLKPSNILVTAEGEAKLLDFGISKVVGEAQEADAGLQTQTLRWMMTPAYAAPEQLQGRPVSMATDVYALGIVLYELLSGHRPYHQDGLKGADAAGRHIPSLDKKAAATETLTTGGSSVEITPEMVSRARATTPAQLQRRLRGDLNTLVQKALRQEPAQRYETVAALAVDVDRYLKGRPIRAQKPTVGYRARKFVRRHRVEVGIVAGALVLLLAGAVWSVVQLRQERDTAQAEARKAQVILGALTQVFEPSNPFSMEADDADSLFNAHLLDRMGRSVSQLSSQPEAQFELAGLMGRIYYEQGRYAEADSLHRVVLAQKKAVLGPAHPDLAPTLDDIGINLLWIGQIDEAETYIQEAFTIRAAHYPPDDYEMTESYYNLAQIAYERRALTEAEAWYKKVVAIDRASGKPLPAEDARVLVELASILVLQAKYEEALTYLEEVDAIYKAEGVDQKLPYIQILNTYAHLYEGHGQYADAEEKLRACFVLMKGLEGHPEYASLQIRLSEVLIPQKKYAAAEAELLGALAIFQATLGPASVDTQETAQALIALYDQWGKPAQGAALRPLIQHTE